MRAKGVLPTPPLALTTMRLERTMAGIGNTDETRVCEACGRTYSRKEKRVTKGRFARSRACSRQCFAVLPKVLCKLKTHGMSHSPEFGVWWAMRKRCENPNTEQFDNYGGRGISVCKRWRSFGNFIADMGSRPSCGHSIDRIDVNGNYEPDNCRWATKAEQARNRRNNIYATINGETKVLKDWADKLGIAYTTVRYRMKRLGMSAEEALNTPAGTIAWAGSGMKGVYHHPSRRKPWQARIHVGGNRYKSLGYYTTKEEAAAAYREADTKHSGAEVPR